MKYQKTFFFVCGCVFLATITLITFLILDIVRVINISSFMLMILVFGVLATGLLSFACGCILLTMYDNAKARRANTNDKWKHE